MNHGFIKLDLKVLLWFPESKEHWKKMKTKRLNWLSFKRTEMSGSSKHRVINVHARDMQGVHNNYYNSTKGGLCTVCKFQWVKKMKIHPTPLFTFMSCLSGLTWTFRLWLTKWSTTFFRPKYWSTKCFEHKSVLSLKISNNFKVNVFSN